MSGSLSDEAFDINCNQACQTAEHFCATYYKAMDKERHKIKGLYLDTAVLVWNGNHVSGNAEIVKFLENLPSSEHIAEAVDAQPLMDSLSPGKLTTLATVSGSSKFHNNKATTFMQNFTLTAVNNVLKIVSDSVRFFE